LNTDNINILKPGYQLHWYRITSVLGQGGFGITYLAEDLNLQEKVAIKEYYPSLIAARTDGESVRPLSENHADDYQWGLDRFINEARTLTQFRNASIVRVRSVFEHNQTAYMVMDFVEGNTLASELKNKKTLPQERLLSLFLPLLDGLEVVHAVGFIHRDIKPDNIIVQDNCLILIDFGAARQAAGERSMSMTQIVSAGYAPFEQYQSNAELQGPWTDIYALGATLYRAVTGITPSTAIDRSKALLETSRDTYVSTSEICGTDYTTSLLNAIDHALTFRAEERPVTIAAWRAELLGSQGNQLHSETLTQSMPDSGPWDQDQCIQIQQQLDQVLTNPAFAAAEQLQRLLRYLVEETLAGRGERITQTSIAIDVLGRDAKFDAATDAAARVEIKRLRSRLIEYYYDAGQADRIRFDLPKGRYTPEITIIPEPDKTVVITAGNSIAARSYRLRGKARRQLARFLSVRGLAYTGILAVIAVLLLIGYQYTNVEGRVPFEIKTDKPATAAKSPADKIDHKSIAVLPFASESASNERASFLADGLHDDLLTQLSKINDMRVISRTSVMRYKETTESIPQIAKELNVAMVMEGSVLRSGDRIRIHVQLIDAKTDEHLWAESYDRTLTTADIFDIQRDIAIKAATSLQATISPEERQRLAIVPTNNLSAYEAYTHGRQKLLSRNSTDLAEATEYFQKAIDLDPGFALAYTGLADSYMIQADYSGVPLNIILPKAKTAIDRALELNNQLGEAYASRANYKFWVEDNTNGAEADMKRALELNPNYATAHHWYANYLMQTGKDGEALLEYEKASSLDPLSPAITASLGGLYQKLGKGDKAIALFQKTIELNPTSPIGYMSLAGIYQESGRYDEALRWQYKGHMVAPKNIRPIIEIGSTYETLGDYARAECWYLTALQLQPESSLINMILAYMQKFSGNAGEARHYLDSVIQRNPDSGLAKIFHIEEDLDNGRYDAARGKYAELDSAMFSEPSPTIDENNLEDAITVSFILRHTGELERADLLLEKARAVLTANENHDLLDVQLVRLYAVSGDVERALQLIAKAVTGGWRENWQFHLLHDPVMVSLQHEPAFLALVDRIKSDMAGQLSRIREMPGEAGYCTRPL